MSNLESWDSRELGNFLLAGLTEALQAPDAEARRIAVLNLGRVGSAALPAAGALATLLAQDPIDELRHLAAQALAQLGPGAVAYLLPALGSADPATRDLAEQVLHSLGRRREELGIVLLDLLAHESAPVRAKAALSLAQLQGGTWPELPAPTTGRNAVLEALHRSLADSDSLVRLTAAHGLWLVARDASGVGTLREILQGPDQGAQALARELLTLMGYRPLPQAGESDNGPKGLEAILPDLIVLVEEASPASGLWTWTTLCEHGLQPEAVIATARRLLKEHTDEHVRAAAARVLGHIPGACAALSEALGDRSSVVLEAIADALRSASPSRQLISALRSALRHASGSAKYSIERRLRDLGPVKSTEGPANPDAFPRLLERARTEWSNQEGEGWEQSDTESWLAWEQAVCDLSDPAYATAESVAVLLSSSAPSAERALVAMGAAAVPLLRESLGDARLGYYAALALAQMKPADASDISALVDRLEKHEWRGLSRAFQVLADLGPAAIPPVRAAYERHPRPQLVELLARLGEDPAGLLAAAHAFLNRAQSDEEQKDAVYAVMAIFEAKGDATPLDVLYDAALGANETLRETILHVLWSRYLRVPGRVLEPLLHQPAPSRFAGWLLRRCPDPVALDAGTVVNLLRAHLAAHANDDDASAAPAMDIGTRAEAVDPLLEVADDHTLHSTVRSAAVRALGLLGRPAEWTLPRLRDLVSDPELGPAAAEAVEHLQWCAGLVESLTSPDLRERWKAAEELWAQGLHTEQVREAILHPVMAGAVSDQDEVVLDLLYEAAPDEPDVLHRIVNSLHAHRRHAREAAEHLIAHLIRDEARRWTVRLQDPDPQLRLRAVDMLRHYRPTAEIKQAVVAACQDPVDEVRQRAREAMAGWARRDGTDPGPPINLDDVSWLDTATDALSSPRPDRRRGRRKRP